MTGWNVQPKPKPKPKPKHEGRQDTNPPRTRYAWRVGNREYNGPVIILSASLLTQSTCGAQIRLRAPRTHATTPMAPRRSDAKALALGSFQSLMAMCSHADDKTFSRYLDSLRSRSSSPSSSISSTSDRPVQPERAAARQWMQASHSMPDCTIGCEEVPPRRAEGELEDDQPPRLNRIDKPASLEHMSRSLPDIYARLEPESRPISILKASRTLATRRRSNRLNVTFSRHQDVREFWGEPDTHTDTEDWE